MSAPDPLERLRVLEISSANFPDQVTKLLCSKDYQECIPTLQGETLVWLVEFLNNVINNLDPTHHVFSNCFFELRRICGTRETLPKSTTIPVSLLSVADQPFASGGITDMYERSFNGSKVCVEKVRIYSNGDQQKVKMFYLEVITWQRLNHTNIVPFLGCTLDPPQLVSVWMLGGGLMEYINERPEKNRLALLHDIAEGLSYLHSRSVIHGDVKGSNILVDHFGRARITGFARTTVTRVQGPACDAQEMYDHVTQWTAPEILEGRGGFTEESDVFSFAMVMIEIFTGAIPFGNYSLVTSVTYIIQGKRPPRPTNPTLTDGLWALMQSCWDQQPRSRPQMLGVLEAVPGFFSKRFQRLRESSRSSPEFLLVLGRFYDSCEYEDWVTNLRDTALELEEFVNFLDSVLSIQGLTRELFERTLRNLRDVCDRHAIFPGTHKVSGGVSKSFAKTSHTEVWKGELSTNGDNTTRTDVCLKAVKIKKKFHGELVLWVKLNHPNILRCFGVTLDPLQTVTEWAPNGHVMEYLQEHRDADRIHFLIDVALGLEHLHSYGVVHGNLKPQNVLVNVTGRACLSDAGFAAVVRDKEFEFSWDKLGSHASRWVAPEIFKNGKSSKQSDMFSYGLVAAEILLGEFLWAGVGVKEVRSKIVSGQRPRTPESKEELGLTVEFWWTLAKCWEMEPEDRISVSDMLDFLLYMPHPISGTSYGLETAVTAAKCQPGQDLIDKLDQILEKSVVSDQERPEFLNILCKMCSRQRSIPTSMVIMNCDDEEPNPARIGGHADVFRGVHRGCRVAIKVLRVNSGNPDRQHRFCREATAWKHLQHPNILPLLGANLMEHRFAMVSEWMDHGNINEFIQVNVEVNRAQLLVDVAHGLEYLHGHRIIHGDLKGANVLIKKDHRACLADFGLSTIIYAAPRASLNAPSPLLTSETSEDSKTSAETKASLVSYTPGGTYRWTSPEILMSGVPGTEECRPSKQSDCYSLAMTVYEVLYGKVPYSDLSKYAAVAAILDGVRPRKPCSATKFGFTDGLWKVMERCWMAEREARPDLKTVLSQLNHAAWTWSRDRFV